MTRGALRLPPLGSLRVFEAAARTRNFTRAAEELGMTQAAVSWQVRNLEQRLGQPLFEREGTRLQLTANGQRLAAKLVRAFDLLHDALAEIQTEELTLAITSTPSFANLLLQTRLPEFLRLHPALHVHMEAALEVRDLSEGGFDLGIRNAREPAPGLTAIRLFPMLCTPLLAPSLLERFGPLSVPADLLRFPLYWDQQKWPEWFRVVGYADEVKPPHTIRASFTTQDQMAGAVEAGEGVAMLSPVLFQDALAAGRLVRPFAPVIDTGKSYWLAHPARPAVPAAVHAFRDWLLGAVSGLGSEP